MSDRGDAHVDDDAAARVEPQLPHSMSTLPRRGLYRRLARQSSIYTAGTLLQQGTSLILLPFYLHYLTPQDFGLLALTEIFSALLAALLGLGIATAITRFYWQWKQEGVERGAVGSLWLLGSGFAVAVALLVEMWGPAAAPLLFSNVPFDPYLRLALWYALFAAFTQAPLALLRIREEAGAFVRWSYIASASTLLLNLYFVAVAQRGALGVLWGNLIGVVLSALVGTWVMMRRVSFDPRPAQVREALRFTLPMLPAGLLENASGGVDRYILDKFLPLSQLGIYSVALRIANAGVRTIALTSFKTAWVPFAIRLNSEREDGRVQTAQFANLILAGAGLLAVLTALFAKDVLWLFGRGAYIPAVPYVTILVFANLMLVLDQVAVIGFLMGKRTEYALPLTVIQFAACVVLNAALIPRLGAMGAAVATAATYAVGVACRFAIAQRFYAIPYEWRRLLGVFGLVAVTLVAAHLLAHLEPSVSSVLLKLATLGAYATLAIPVVFHPRTIVALWAALTERWRTMRYKGAPGVLDRSGKT